MEAFLIKPRAPESNDKYSIQPVKVPIRKQTELREWKQLFAACSYQAEGVVCVHDLLYAVLFQHHHIVQIGAALTCTVLTVNHVRLPAVVLARHKQQIEHLHLGQGENTESLGLTI